MSFGFEKQAFRVGNKKCTADRSLGFLGSNALTFDGTVPKFDNITKTVRYKVAPPHYMPDGKEFEGVFDGDKLQITGLKLSLESGIEATHLFGEKR